MELDFDDVLLKPVLSNVNHRGDADISVELAPFLKLEVPIIASPMVKIISAKMISDLSDLGAMGILHRFYHNLDEWEHDLFIAQSKNFGISVDMSDNAERMIDEALDCGAKIVCLDVANGYARSVIDRCKELSDYIKSKNCDCLFMSGVVVTREGAIELCRHGVDLIRTGIGGGAVCSTRSVTGVGRKQLSAIQDCAPLNLPPIFKIISDGGIRDSGDIVKAISFGAHAVMIGSLFSKTFESPHDGYIRGMASKFIQEEYFHEKIKSIEGIEKQATKIMSLEELVSYLAWGIKSACTYLNVSTLLDLRKVDYFI